MDKPFDQDSTFAELNEAATRELTDSERQIASLVLATNTAVIQFIMEGLLKPADQAHFMVHLQDAYARLYTRDDVIVHGERIELSVDSKAGELALTAIANAVNRGKLVWDKKPTSPNKQPSDAQYNWGAPVDSKRTLN